jgi:hypothetical protein
MEHEVFVSEWHAGRLRVDVDRSLALRVVGSDMLPRRYQFAHIFWSWVWILSIPTAFAVMYFLKWWAGLLMLLFLTPLLSKSTKTSAFQFMIDHALESPDFYQWAIENRLIIVSPKAQTFAGISAA